MHIICEWLAHKQVENIAGSSGAVPKFVHHLKF
jgi:hypothetical protein